MKLINKIKKLPSWELSLYKNAVNFGLSFGAFLSMLTIPFMAYTIDSEAVWMGFRNLFNSLYGVVVGIATIVAVTLIAYNIIVLMISKNDKKAEVAMAWIKAIIIAWLCLMCMSIIIKLIKSVALINTGTDRNGALFKY